MMILPNFIAIGPGVQFRRVGPIWSCNKNVLNLYLAFVNVLFLNDEIHSLWGRGYAI